MRNKVGCIFVAVLYTSVMCEHAFAFGLLLVLVIVAIGVLWNKNAGSVKCDPPCPPGSDCRLNGLSGKYVCGPVCNPACPPGQRCYIDVETGRHVCGKA